MRIALFEPDIPQNTGAILRLAACLGIAVDIVGPPGFVLSDARLRRAGLDYAAHVALSRHDDFAAFRRAIGDRARLLLMTTRGDTDYRAVAYRDDDVIVMGRESAGVPEAIHGAADLRLVIPLAAGMRSLNVALAAAMVTGEALRQLGRFPGDPARAL